MSHSDYRAPPDCQETDCNVKQLNYTFHVTTGGFHGGKMLAVTEFLRTRDATKNLLRSWLFPQETTLREFFLRRHDS